MKNKIGTSKGKKQVREELEKLATSMLKDKGYKADGSKNKGKSN